jgi:hypothetical protein
MARDPREIFETLVYSFSPKSSIFSQILIKVKFLLVNIEKSTLVLKQPSRDQVEFFFKSGRKNGFRENSNC